MEPTILKKACIIGAGPRGLVTARHLSEVTNLKVTLFEAQDDLGGMWLYKELNTFDAKFEEQKKENIFYNLYQCYPNSIYQNLVTNVPYFVMEFKDLGIRDVEKDIPLYIEVQQYKKYLDAYADKFSLRKLIYLNTVVKSIRLTKNLDKEEKQAIRSTRKFVLKTVGSKGESGTETETIHDFDYIIIACGQCCNPYIPKLKGIENFKGKTIHCKDYRDPNLDIFRNKKILILGGNFSTYDVIAQLLNRDPSSCEGCEKIIMCARKAETLKCSDDYHPFIESGKLILRQGSVTEIKGTNTVCFSDGTEEEVDTIVYATGYRFKFPYFDFDKDNIIDHDEENNRGAFFGPLYKKFVAIREPDVFFVGFFVMSLLLHIVPELQALAIKYLIEGKLELPTPEVMMQSFKEEVELHLKNVGDLAHFFKLNLTSTFPEMPNNLDVEEWKFFSNWLKAVHPNNDEVKSKEFFDLICRVKEVRSKHHFKFNFISCVDEDFHLVYPKEYRNTSDFV